MEEGKMMGPLQGIKVLELIRVGPAAFCTQMLGDMGAEVLKVESVAILDHTKGSGSSPGEENRRLAAANPINRNKKSIGINLKIQEGQRILQKLAASYDVLVEGFRPGVMARLGGDYDTLSKINPRLIYCSLSGYGQTGPYRNFPAHDVNFISLGGVLKLIGERDRLPVMPLNLVADYAGAALHGVIGILLAVIARSQTGRGQMVDIAYLDTVISLLGATSMSKDFFSEGIVPQRGDGAFSGEYPHHAVYETKDGEMVSIGCTEPWLWENFCRAIGREDLNRFHAEPDHFQRAANDEEKKVTEELRGVFKTRTREEWFDLLTKAEVCVGKVYNFKEVFEDPQVKERRMLVEIDDPKVGRVGHPGIAIKLSDTPGSIRSLSPTLGEHADQVMADLGYSLAEIQELKEKQVIK